MLVSVVVCSHTLDRYGPFEEAVESVLSGSYDDVELVLVSDGNRELYERLEADFGGLDGVVIHCNEENVGLLESRNTGAELASGDVVAFIDDDAVACERWLERLVSVYESRDVLAVGGRMTPEWVAGKPAFLPAEFYWLVGVTHRGFGPGGGFEGWVREGEVRNTKGSNISFRAEVFDELGGFETDVGGRKGDNHLQGGETELCARLRAEYDEGVWYVPNATVDHKVFEYRTRPRWLAERAFWQGYSKRGMEVFVPESAGEEGVYLAELLTVFLPHRLRRLVRRPSRAKLLRVLAIPLFTVLVGLGYLYGVAKWR
jgi:glycosyltransferase involved in cell wall biosynthesis